MMKTRKELKIAGLVLLTICMGLLGLDTYSRLTWDHYIVGEYKNWSFIKPKGDNNRNNRRALTEQEVQKYTDMYPKTLKIKKHGNSYILESYKNITLTKTEEFSSSFTGKKPIKNSFRKYVFSDQNETIKITILANKYDAVGCSPHYHNGATSVYWTIENDEVLVWTTIVSVYESLINKWSCNRWGKYFSGQEN